MKIKKIIIRSIQYAVVFSLIGLIIFNSYLFLFQKDILTFTKSQIYSLNKGESYSGLLNFWHLLVQNGDWSDAQKLESKIDPSDISTFKLNYQPERLQTQLKNLTELENKSADDWIELAKVNSILGHVDEAKKDITNAHNLDPIRDDISKLYYQIGK
jgi:hypothetical protein